VSAAGHDSHPVTIQYYLFTYTPFYFDILAKFKVIESLVLVVEYWWWFAQTALTLSSTTFASVH
jgi:hypothetical protein